MTSACHSGLVRRLGRFRDDENGVSAVEFAMLLPLMITLYLGSIEVTQAVSADRKMTLVAGTIGDLVAQTQNSCVSTSEITAVFDAGKAVLYPYNANLLKAVVTSVTIDANQTAKVLWSKTLNGATARSGDVTASIPAALRSAAGSVIWAEAYYTYVPVVGKVIAPSGVTLGEKIFLKPRNTASISIC